MLMLRYFCFLEFSEIIPIGTEFLLHNVNYLREPPFVLY